MVLFVDACAGRGMDDVGNHGSPIIAAKAALSAQAQLRNAFKRDVRIQVIAIEKKKANYDALVDNLRPFGDLARTLRGDFAEHVPAIVREFAGVPTLWFIDPFGIEALDSSILRQAIAGPESEALIMSLDRGALRHLCVAVAPETRLERDPKRSRRRFTYSRKIRPRHVAHLSRRWRGAANHSASPEKSNRDHECRTRTRRLAGCAREHAEAVARGEDPGNVS